MGAFDFFTRRTSRQLNAALWDKTADRRSNHTPDLRYITDKEQFLVFVYDTMKTGYPDHSDLNSLEHVCSAMTKSDEYVLWVKDYQQDYTTAAAVRAPLPDPNDKRYDPRKPDPGRIRGQLHVVRTETLFELDEKMANTLYFERKRINVELPWTGNSMRKVRGMWVPCEEPQIVRAWAYIATADAIAEEQLRSVRPARRFTPIPREHNTRKVNGKPYYDFTRFDLKFDPTPF
jgi:hypothetical protein